MADRAAPRVALTRLARMLESRTDNPFAAQP